MSTGREQLQTKAKNYTLLLIYINVALYATCFQIQRPLEPFLVEKLGLKGDSGGEYAKLQSFFSVMQTLGSLVAGPCLDRFGAKGGFIISFLASALSYYLLSRATTLELLYISKIPTVFQAGYMCAQLAASQATSDGADRVLALGRLSMSYTIGSVLGPALGGFLGASGDYYLGARIAVLGSLISVIITFFIPSNNSSTDKNEEDVKNSNESLPNMDGKCGLTSEGGVTSRTLENEDKKTITTSSIMHTIDGKIVTNSFSQSVVNQVSSIAGVVRIVWLLLSVKIISSTANSMMSETFPLILKNVFSLNEQSLGLAIASNSAFNGVVNGLFLAPMVAYTGGDLTRVITLCVFFMACLALTLSLISLPSFSALPIFSLLSSSAFLSNGLFGYLALTYVLSIFQYALSTTITGQSTSMVQKTQKGTLLGVEHSFFALARVVAPQVGVLLLQQGGISAVTAVSGSIYLAVSLLWNTCKFSLKENSKNHFSFMKNKNKSTEEVHGGERKGK